MLDLATSRECAQEFETWQTKYFKWVVEASLSND